MRDTERREKRKRAKERGLGVLRSVLLAMVPLKEREMDFLDSSSAGVCSRGAELTCGAVGDGTWTTTKEFRFNKHEKGECKLKRNKKGSACDILRTLSLWSGKKTPLHQLPFEAMFIMSACLCCFTGFKSFRLEHFTSTRPR